jgi:hypothetical protein
VLQRLPWWRQPADVQPYKLVEAGMAKLAGTFEPGLFKASPFQLGPRAAEDGPSMVEWQASVAQLTAAHGSQERSNLSPRLYWAGWEWSGFVQWNTADGSAEGKTLGMFTIVSTSALLELPVKPKAVRATMASNSNTLQRNIVCSEVGWGWPAMPAAPTSEAVAAALGPHLQGAQLALTHSVRWNAAKHI